MKKRTITGIIMLMVLVPLFLIPQLFIGLHIIIGLGVLVAIFELLKVFKNNYNIKTKSLIYILSILTYLSLTWHFKDVDQNIILNLLNYKVVIMFLINVLVLMVLTILDEKFTFNDFSKVISSIMYVTFGLGSLVILRIIGIPFIIFLFLTTMLTDIFAYIFGIKYGKNKLAPKISPNKSWEGAIAGTVIATVVVGLLGTFYGSIFKGNVLNPNNYQTLLDGFNVFSNINTAGKGILIFIIAFMLSIVGQVGDLIASKIKREYDVKDFGNVFPGHGGVLDRFDSAMFAGIFLVILTVLLTII